MAEKQKTNLMLMLAVLAFVAGAALTYVLLLQQTRQSEGALRQHDELTGRLDACGQTIAEQNLNYTLLLNQYNSRLDQITNVNKKIDAASSIINECYSRLSKYENVLNAMP